MARLIKGLETKLIHGGEPEPLIEGAVTMPIFQSSTFEYGGPDQLSRPALHPAQQHAQSRRAASPSWRRSKTPRPRW